MDKDSFARAVEAAGDMLYRVAFNLLRNNDDCRDAMQEAALKAWIKRGTLRDEGRFTTWLTRILINECRNIQRRRSRLPLVLRYSEGMDEKEIADILGITRAAARGRIHRAKQQLRKELEEQL